MWEEGMNTKPQIYYNNNNKKKKQYTTGKQTKKGKLDEDNVHWNIQNEKTHTENKITQQKKTYTEEHAYIKKHTQY